MGNIDSYLSVKKNTRFQKALKTQVPDKFVNTRIERIGVNSPHQVWGTEATSETPS